MAKLTLEQLKTRVKVKVDEYTPAGVSHSFDDYLEPMLNEAADELTDKAPKYLLDPTALTLTSAKHDDDLYFIPAPSDFARLYDVRFPMWDKTVLDVISYEHPDYEKQENPYTRAGYGRPVVVIKSVYPEGGSLQKYLVCGKVLEGAKPTFARYIGYKTPATMPESLDEALTWLAAAKLLQILEYPAQAKLAHEAHQGELVNKLR